MVEGIILKLLGTVVAASTWHIGNVELPVGPSSLKVNGGINKETISKSADDPVVIVDGSSGSSLSLSGSIADESKTDAQLWEDIISPLLELKGSEVTLVCPIASLNSVYLLEQFEPSRDTYASIYSYSMKLSKTSLTIIMAPED
jgi:hypothetical protein